MGKLPLWTHRDPPGTIKKRSCPYPSVQALVFSKVNLCLPVVLNTILFASAAVACPYFVFVPSCVEHFGLLFPCMLFAVALC